MIARCRRWTLAVFLLALCLVASCGGDGGTKPADPIPVCRITPSSLVFDTVAVGLTKDLTFTIKNTGTGTLTGSVSESCPAYAIQSGGGSYSLTANQEKIVTVRFAPTSAGLQSCAVSLGATACESIGCSGMGTEQPPVTGSCCAPVGTCTVTTQAVCSDTWTEGGVCTPNPCTQPPTTGSCCATAGTCTVTTQAACISPSTWLGAGTSCSPNPCTAPPGMVRISAGTFTMGSPTGEPGRWSDETQHQVTLTKAIYVSTYEVTQPEWQSVMGWNESYFPGTGKPVQTVTWYDAVSYCNQRSGRDGYTPAYAITGATMDGNHVTNATVTWNQAANGYRLLTEAEWEYACRATSPTAFCNGPITNLANECGDDPGLDLVGWYCGNASFTTHDCGGKTANAWGLKDMHGNVWEWCWDWYGDYTGDATDPLGPPSGSFRVFRGGDWDREARFCRSAYRNCIYPDYHGDDTGLRLARTSP